jgi:hypothetical protein
MNKELVQLINNQVETNFNEELSIEALQSSLSIYINDLILNDFAKLFNILYKIDVDEQKLKKILKEDAQKDASIIIASMIIEREMQKFKSREQNKNKK